MRVCPPPQPVQVRVRLCQFVQGWKCITNDPYVHDLYRQHHCCSLYQQTGWDPFPHLVTSGNGSVPMATNSKYSHLGHISGCSDVIADWLSRPNQPSTTECSLNPKIVNQIFGTWGTPAVCMFATVHNMHLPQFFVSCSRALSTKTGSGGWCTCFQSFPCSAKSFRSSRPTRRAKWY